MLKIGIDRLLDEKEQMDYTKIDFAAILGQTDTKGHWLDIEETKMDVPETDQRPPEASSQDNMYMFEGVDYRSAVPKGEIDLFDQIIRGDGHGTSSVGRSSERGSTERGQRRQMTEEEKVARAAKARETKARRHLEMVRHRYERCFHTYVLLSAGRSAPCP